jgi:quercetin dioxygenase-like cupin family protein
MGKWKLGSPGQPFRLKAVEMIIMPANKPHSLRAIASFKMMQIMIRSEVKVPDLIATPGR